MATSLLMLPWAPTILVCMLLIQANAGSVVSWIKAPDGFFGSDPFKEGGPAPCDGQNKRNCHGDSVAQPPEKPCSELDGCKAVSPEESNHQDEVNHNQTKEEDNTKKGQDAIKDGGLTRKFKL